MHYLHVLHIMQLRNRFFVEIYACNLFFLENSCPENIYTFLSVVFKITCHLKTYDSIVVIYDFNLQDKYANTFFFLSVWVEYTFVGCNFLSTACQSVNNFFGLVCHLNCVENVTSWPAPP